MVRKAANIVYNKSGIGPEQVDVIELHDCFSANELITYEALGLCEEGEILFLSNMNKTILIVLIVFIAHTHGKIEKSYSPEWESNPRFTE